MLKKINLIPQYGIAGENAFSLIILPKRYSSCGVNSPTVLKKIRTKCVPYSTKLTFWFSGSLSLTPPQLLYAHTEAGETLPNSTEKNSYFIGSVKIQSPVLFNNISLCQK